MMVRGIQKRNEQDRRARKRKTKFANEDNEFYEGGEMAVEEIEERKEGRQKIEQKTIERLREVNRHEGE